MQLLKGDPKIKIVGDPELRICNLLSHSPQAVRSHQHMLHLIPRTRGL